MKLDDNGVVEDDGGLENLMLVLRSGIEDAAAEDAIPIALLSFSSMDWGVTGRVGSFKEALADANTWAIRPLERAEEEAATEEDEEEEKDEDEEEEDVVHPSLAYIRSSLLTVGSMRVVNNEIVVRRLAWLSYLPAAAAAAVCSSSTSNLPSNHQVLIQTHKFLELITTLIISKPGKLRKILQIPLFPFYFFEFSYDFPEFHIFSTK